LLDIFRCFGKRGLYLIRWYLIADPDDVPILLSAMQAHVDYLATHNTKHFIDDPKVAERAGIKIGTPGDVLAWIRENL